MSQAQKMSRDAWLLIVFGALRQVTMLFFSTFFISYIMQIATNEIVSVSMYKLFEYAATAFGFFAFVSWCKRRDKTKLFALNTVPKIILLVMIVALGDNVVNYIMPMGILFGVGAAMYHLPMHLMVGEKVPSQLMSRFVGAKNAALYITQVVAPVVLGIFITVGSYHEMAWALLALTAVEIVLCFYLAPSKHRANNRTDFLGLLRCMWRFSVIRKLMWTGVMRGFSMNTTLGTVITMYTVYMFHTDLNLGFLTTVFSMCSIATSVWLARCVRRENFPRMLTLSTLLIFGVMTLFVISTTPITFLIYNFIYATAMVVLTHICETNVYNLSQSRCVNKSHRAEYFALYDGALFIGRWIAFLIMMYIGVFADASMMRYLLGAMTVVAVMCGAVSVVVSRRIRNR